MKRAELDIELSPVTIGLTALGAIIGLFTAQGGFNSEGFDAGRTTRIISLIGGAILGFIGAKMIEQ